MKTLRKRKIAKACGMTYKSVGLEYRGITDLDKSVYDLSMIGSRGIGAFVRKPYDVNFKKELEFLKSLN